MDVGGSDRPSPRHPPPGDGRRRRASDGRGQKPALEREWLADHGVDVATFACDVRDRQQVERTVEETRERLGEIDVLVNNAGIIQVGPLARMSLADFEDALATNVWGLVYATLAVLPAMRRRGSGRIVNITSIGGKVAVARCADRLVPEHAPQG